MANDFPFTISSVAYLCGIKTKGGSRKSEYVDCPFCGRRKKMNFNYEKNVFHCPACGEGGHMLALYSKLKGLSLSNGEITAMIKDELNISDDTPEKQIKKEKPKRTNDIINTQIDVDRMKHLDCVYRAFLNKLCLSDMHKQKLYDRQLTDDDIKLWQFRSVPILGYKSICKELIEENYILEGVPGFYLDVDKWNVNFNPKMTGIIVPTFNILGYIEGLQVRLDRPFGKTKYMWLTSDGKYKGTGAKAIPFFVKGTRRNDTLVITEGAFKAIIPNKVWGYSILGIAGVNNQKELFKIIPIIKKMGYTKIVEAFDADYRFNESVKKAKETLKCMLTEQGFAYSSFEWDYAEGKGLDDYAISVVNKITKESHTE